MFLTLYFSIFNAIQYFLPQTSGQLTYWEKQWLERISEGDGYRLATAEYDTALISKITTLSKAANLKNIPKLVIYRNGSTEAKSLWNGTILISTGAVKNLNSDELEVLLAHEIGHNCHKKTSIMVDPVCAVSILTLAAFSTKKISNAIGLKVKNHFSFLNILGISAVFSGCTAIIEKVVNIPRMAFKRTLERDADRTALLLTGKSEALKSLFLRFEKEEISQSIKPIQPTNSTKDSSFHVEKRQHQNITDQVLNELLKPHPHPQKRISHIEALQKKIKKENNTPIPLSHFW